jgi:hypothetical protein
LTFLAQFRTKGLIFLGVALVALAALVALGGNALVNGPVRARLERALAGPGSQVRIGRLTYAPGANRLVAQNVTLQTGPASLTADRIALSGIRWFRLWRGDALAESLARAHIEVTQIAATWPKARYRFRCGRLVASVPDATLRAEEAELRPLVGDQALFRGVPYRTTRWRVTVPELTVAGLGYPELLTGSACQVESVRVVRPALDLLVDRYQAVGPLVRSPLMLNEAVASIGRPFQVKRVEITGGRLDYGECRVAGEPPGRLTFTAMSLLAEGLANPGPGLLRLHAQGRLMAAGLLAVTLEVPLQPRGCTFRYHGSLGAMALPRLDAFLDRAERTRLRSGAVDHVAFTVTVHQGKAEGRVQAAYQDLKLAVLDRDTDTEKGLKNRMATFFANTFKIRPDNPSRGSAPAKEGKVAYERKPEDTFLQVLWFSLRSGVLDLIKR